MSQPTTNPRKIRIVPYSFNTPLAATLVTALDDELSEMYPDWEELPHPGFQQAWVGGDAPTEYKNPAPDLTLASHNDTTVDEGRAKAIEAWENRDMPVLDALDADDGVTSPNTTTTKPTVPSDEPSEILPDLTKSQVSTLHFHIAFDVTTLPPSTDTNQGTAIGCIGLKLMPFFPHHRAHPTTPSQSPVSPIRTAELKRIYIAPSHRGVRIQLVDGPQGENVRLPEALVATATAYARERLGVRRLVLETGFRQVAAVKVYERLGWRRVADYGDYVGAGVEDGGVSMCYEMDLS